VCRLLHCRLSVLTREWETLVALPLARDCIRLRHKESKGKFVFFKIYSIKKRLYIYQSFELQDLSFGPKTALKLGMSARSFPFLLFAQKKKKKS
jgi:hypothetical protein